MHTNSHTPIFHLLCLSLLLLLNPTLSNSHNTVSLPYSRPSIHHDSNFAGHRNRLASLFEEDENSTTTNANTNPGSNYVSMLKQNNFFGTWSSLDSVTRPFNDFFGSSAGLLVIEVLDTDTVQPSDYSSRLARKFNMKQNLFNRLRRFQMAQSFRDFTPWTLMIKMYDGAYVDQNSANVFYQVTFNTPISFDPNNTTLSINNSTISVSLKDGDGDGRLFKQCSSNFSLYFADKRNLQPFIAGNTETSNVGLVMQLISPECGISVASGILTLDGFMDPYQTYLYTFFVCTIAIVQILGAYKVKFQVQNRKMAFRVSAGSIWLMATVDYYMLIMNLVLVFAYSVQFVAPLLLYLFLTFYVERDIIVSVLKAHKRNSLELSDENCKSCGFHFGISTIMFVVELIFILMSKLWVIHFTALVFIPQIVHNARKAKPYVFNFYQVFLMGVPRVAFVAYLKLYPENIFRLHPDTTFVLIYSSIMGMQIIILLSQTITPLGCLFFLSKKRKKSRVLEEDDVCPICMGDLKSEAGSQTVADSALLNLGETIETPCSHVFHTECLKKWIQNKVECPVCRERVDEILEEVIVSEEDGQRQIPETGEQML